MVQRLPQAAFATLLVCCSLADGCSSERSGACEEVSPCGGDISGTWDIVSGCLTIQSPFSQPECRVAVQSSEFIPTGTVTYTPSPIDPQTGTFQPNYRYRFAAREAYSAACLAALGFTTGSDEGCLGLQVLWGGPFAVSCSPAERGCVCDFADEQVASQSADYTVHGGQIVLSATSVVGFCRTGDSLLESAATDSSISRVTLHRRTP